MTEEERQFILALQQAQQQNFFASTHSGGSIYGGYWSSRTPALYSANSGAYSGAGYTAAQVAAQQSALLAWAAARQAELYPPPPPVEDAGISAGEIIGHRVWFCRPHDGLLTSMAVDTIWPPLEPVNGDVEKGLGVHAFKSQQEALTQYGQMLASIIAVGTVLLWGDVMEHEKGYRAEYGKVRSVDFLVGVKWAWRERRLLRRIRQRYGLT